MRTLQRINLGGLLFIVTVVLVLVTCDAGFAAQQEATKTDKAATPQAATPQTATAQTATSQAVTPQEDLSKKDDVKSDAAVEDTGFIYDPTGKTDPFKSFISVKEEEEESDNKKPRTYLETLELSQLNLVVIVVSPSGRWAMVKDSKEVGHVIKEGTLIGTNGGVVSKINEGEVIIKEEYKDFRGQMQTREIIKSLPTL